MTTEFVKQSFLHTIAKLYGIIMIMRKISINFKHVPKFFWHGTRADRHVRTLSNTRYIRSGASRLHFIHRSCRSASRVQFSPTRLWERFAPEIFSNQPVGALRAPCVWDSACGGPSGLWPSGPGFGPLLPPCYFLNIPSIFDCFKHAISLYTTK